MVAAAANTVSAGSSVEMATNRAIGTAVSRAVRGSYRIAEAYPRRAAGMMYASCGFSAPSS